MNVKQKEGKSIRSYLGRFNVVVLEVRDLDQSVAMAALKGGLLRNGLRYSVEKTYPQDIVDMLAWMEKYVRADKAFENESPEDMVTKEKKEEKVEVPPKDRSIPILHPDIGGSELPYGISNKRIRTQQSQTRAHAKRIPFFPDLLFLSFFFLFLLSSFFFLPFFFLPFFYFF